MGGFGSGGHNGGTGRRLVERAPAVDVGALVRAWRGRKHTRQRAHENAPRSTDDASFTAHVRERWGSVDVAVVLMGSERRGFVEILGATSGGSFAHEAELLAVRRHLGGVQWWAVCPGCRCRTGALFAPWDARHPWRCRRCLGLTYASTRDDPLNLAVRRCLALRGRLGAVGESAQPGRPLPMKPPRMRWATYERLRGQLVRAEARANRAMLGAVGSLVSRSTAPR